MSHERLNAAIAELTSAIIEHTSGAGAGVASSASAPAAAFAGAKPHVASQDGGFCPVHGVEWRTTKGDGTPAKRAYCSQKNEDGGYCQERGPWLTSR